MDDKITEIIIKIETALARMEQKLDNVNTTLANHENRIQRLEGKKESSKEESSFKDEMMKLLAKAVLVSVCGFASLAGAGSVIAKFIQ